MKVVKITDIKVRVVETKALIRWVIVKVYTDEGITGLSEAGSVYREEAQAYVIEKLKPFFLGKDAFDIRRIWTSIYKTHLDVRGPGSLEVTALGAIEVALWDIIGKKLDVPIYSLLGGKYNDRVRVYVHCEPISPMVEHTPEWLAKNTVKLVERGFKDLKFDPFWSFPEGETITSTQLINVEKKVKAVRDAAGNDAEVGIEFHAKYNLHSAIRIGKRLEKYEPWFFEEPVGSEDFDALVLLSREFHTPVASGERLCTRFPFKEMLFKHAVDIVQIDPVRAGGFLESICIATMADACYLPILVHDPYGPIYDAICVQFAAMISNLLAMEFPIYYYLTDPPDLRTQLLKKTLKVKHGYIEPPKEPGLGIELDEKILAQYQL